jgi:hypothetical protein
MLAIGVAFMFVGPSLLRKGVTKMDGIIVGGVYIAVLVWLATAVRKLLRKLFES